MKDENSERLLVMRKKIKKEGKRNIKEEWFTLVGEH